MNIYNFDITINNITKLVTEISKDQDKNEAKNEYIKQLFEQFNILKTQSEILDKYNDARTFK